MTTAFTFDGLMWAARECARNVRWKDSVASWVHPRNLASNCLRLLDELNEGTYRLSGYVSFEVTEPKKRTIKAPRFRDRVVQKAMCNAGLYDDLTRGSIHDNAACRTGRGTIFAMNRLKCHLQRHWRRHGQEGWVLRLDIRKFFDSIPHEPLKKTAEREIRNKEFLALVVEVIDSFEDPGIGLGSQVSQLLALAYLSGLDHYIKEGLGIKAYVRYSDDLVLVHPDREVLLNARNEIERSLAALGLALNPKSALHPLKNGVDFLKFRHRLTETGGVVRNMARSGTARIRRRLGKLKKKVAAGERSPQDVRYCFQSWRSHAEKGNSHGKIRRMKKWLDS